MARLSAANKRLAAGFDERAAEEVKVGTKASQLADLKGASAKLAARAKAAVVAAPVAEVKAPRVLPKDFKMPKTLAACADLYYEQRAKRLAIEKTAEEMKNIEGALKDRLIAELPKGEASGIAGKVCRVSVVTKDVPRVEDWGKYYAAIVADYQAHVRKKDGQQDGAFSLLQRSIGVAAVRERWENKVQVPGVGKFTVVDLSVSKL